VLAFGLVLVALSGGLIALLIIGGADDDARFAVSGFEADLSTNLVFLAGAVTGFVLLIGLGITRRGLARSFKRGQETRRLRRRSEQLEGIERERQSDSTDTTGDRADPN
jgi:hypothetical protein